MRMLLKLTLVELKLFVREPITMVFTFALPLIFLFVLGGVFKNTPDPDVYRGVGAMNYYTPAYIGLVIASIAVVGLPVHLTGYRERGVLRRLRASPIPPLDRLRLPGAGQPCCRCLGRHSGYSRGRAGLSRQPAPGTCPCRKRIRSQRY